jgi:hypothetical protein
VSVDWDIGAYITLVTMIIYVGHIAFALSIVRGPNFRHQDVIGPSGLHWN